MRTIKLRAKRDDDTGELGLVIEGASTYAVNSASEGLLIAHDLIEHPRLSGLGRLDDELEALGAIWMCRGQWGDIRRDGVGSAHTAEENIAGDVTRMYVDYCNGADTIDLRARLRTRAHDHDDAFREIIAIGRAEIASELSACGLERADNPHLYGEQLDRYCAAALHYMRRGARIIARRFPGRFTANSQFWAIAEAVQPYARPEYEGARYRLRFGNGEAHCEEFYDDSDY